MDSKINGLAARLRANSTRPTATETPTSTTKPTSGERTSGSLSSTISRAENYSLSDIDFPSRPDRPTNRTDTTLLDIRNPGRMPERDQGHLDLPHPRDSWLEPDTTPDLPRNPIPEWRDPGWAPDLPRNPIPDQWRDPGFTPNLPRNPIPDQWRDPGFTPNLPRNPIPDQWRDPGFAPNVPRNPILDQWLDPGFVPSNGNHVGGPNGPQVFIHPESRPTLS
jgi:hypothetical protein